MASSYDTQLTYAIVYTALTGIMIKPLVILWFISLCLGRRKSDPARTAFTWLKLTMAWWIITLLLYTVGMGLGILEILITNDDSYYYSYSGDSVLRLDEANLFLTITGSMFEMIADIFLLITFTELGNGFQYILTGSRTSTQKVLRYLSIGVGVFLFILGIAWVGKISASWVPYYNYQLGDGSYDSDIYDTLNNNLWISRQLSSSWDIIMWIASIPTVAYAAYTVHKFKKNNALSNSAILYLVATILFFLRLIYTVAFDARFSLKRYLSSSLSDDYYVAGNYITPILNYWSMFVLLVLLFVIAVRKQKGLWTTPQPWNNGQASFGPIGYTDKTGQVVVPQQVAWQGQPVQYQQYPPSGYVLQQQPVMQGWPQQQYVYQQAQPVPQYVQQPNVQQPVGQQPHVQQQNVSAPSTELGTVPGQDQK